MAPVATASPSPLALPRVACFTPLSPVGSGISFYSEDLLPVLARALDLDVFVDRYAPTAPVAAMLRAAGVGVRDGREFERAARDRPYDATIYQIGNSPAHAYMYDRALRAPGVVVLHDVVIHHLRLWMAVNGGRARRRAYTDDLARLYGAAGEELARAVLRGQTPATLFDYPLVEPILDAARAIIVHNAASAERVAALRPAARVRVVPMGVPLPALPARAEARARLGVAPDAFLVVSHGHVNPYKRLDVALRAFRRLRDARPDAHFLVAGSVAPNLGPALDRQVRYLGLGERVRRLGFVSPETVGDLLAAADCCVNLRYPSAGETSASLLRIMGAGLPVLVSDAGSFRELPDGCCLKVPVGPIEETLLAEYLVELARNEPLRAAIGAAARGFVADAHSMERAAAGYLEALGEVVGNAEWGTGRGGASRSSRPALPVILSAAKHPSPIPVASAERLANEFAARRPCGATKPATAGWVRPGPNRRRPVSWRARLRGAVSTASHLPPLPRPPSFRIRRNRPPAPDVPPQDTGAPDPLVNAVAAALGELRLAGHAATERSVARDMVALGLRGAGASEGGGGWRSRLRRPGRR